MTIVELCSRLNAEVRFREKFFANPISCAQETGVELPMTETHLLSEVVRSRKEASGYFLDRDSSPRVAFLKTVTAFKAQYLTHAPPKEQTHTDQELDRRVFSVDLGHLFWRQKLDP